MTIHQKRAHRENYRTGRTGPIRYIVLHYTGNRGDTAKNNADYFARTAVETSAHYFVDGREIWQSVPDGDTAWHCGARAYRHPECRNANSLGVELCDSVDGVPEATRARAAALVRALMAQYSVPAERVLRHYDVTGKICPAPWVRDERAWADFKALLTAPEEKEEDTMELYHWFADMPDWARASAEKAYKKGLLAEDPATHAVSVYASNLQALVWLDRLGLLD